MTEPNVLVTKSTTDGERSGANSWTISTDPLKHAALATARASVRHQRHPRLTSQIASKNPHGMKKAMLL